MRKAVLVALALVPLAGVAWAGDVQITRDIVYPPGTGTFVVSCGSFDVLSDGQMTATLKLQYDKDGVMVKSIEHTRCMGSARVYNSTDPSKEIATSHAVCPATAMIKVGDVYMGAGAFWRIIVPGRGPVFMVLGMVAMDLQTFTIRHSANNQMISGDYGALCEALQ